MFGQGGGRGVKNTPQNSDIIYGWPQGVFTATQKKAMKSFVKPQQCLESSAICFSFPSSAKAHLTKHWGGNYKSHRQKSKKFFGNYYQRFECKMRGNYQTDVKFDIVI